MSLKSNDNSRFRYQNPCCYESSQHHCYKIEIVEVPLGAENKLIAGLLLPFILPSLMLLRKYARQDISHECVVAYIRCRRHDRYYTRTYEIRGQGDKVSNNGCYSEVISVKSLFYIQIGFERLEQLYCEMPSDYNILSNNCKHWSRFLFNKIVDI